MSRFAIRHKLKTALWLIPLLCLIAFIALAVVTLAIDRAGDYKLVSQSVTGSATSLQQILSTAAGSLLSLATVVVSLLLVAIQVAMGQFSPRIVRAILEDRRNQLALGLFIGTFAYTMAVLREIDDQSNTIPGLSVLVSYGLIVAAVAVLILFINRTAQALRVSGLIDLVGDRTLAELGRLRPAGGFSNDDQQVIAAPESGNVSHLDHQRLVAIARDANCRLELVPTMGEFVPRGAPLFRIHGDLEKRADVLACVVLEPERSHESDPSYGIRKLVDIALRSIASSPYDDPTTSVQSLHRIHDCMRLLATRELPTGCHHDSEGELRLVIAVLDWEGYVRLAFDEIRLVGASSPQVARALQAALQDIKSVAMANRQPPLDRQLELLSAAVKRLYEADTDTTAALVPDGLGIGSGRDVVSRVAPNGRPERA